MQFQIDAGLMICDIKKTTVTCTALCKNGNKCNRFSTTDCIGTFCWQHSKMEPHSQIQKARKIAKHLFIKSERIDKYAPLVADAFNCEFNNNLVQDECGNYYASSIKHIEKYVTGVTGLVDPNTGKHVSEKNMAGAVRSYIEENSASSRQHYFRGGKLQPVGWRKNLFYNPGLLEANTLIAWVPYNSVRGTRWYMSPTPTVSLPNRDTLISASLQYRKIGMNGSHYPVKKHYNHSMRFGLAF